MQPKLKSLELHGYKTFASRTYFEFPGLITAIVGPNGSGKSNIADALRWVLGEQSYSMLRGRKTEDMIFSGSEQRSKAGMASATITFDNSDGWLPIDFSEVAITRRAYRDGQNEYLLNGQRVRLREISELLARSGLAERTYTIIGQGLVDAALALKPEERRRLFEEAAGIGLYRSRREDALNRLEATRRNLERVEDILAELEPRLHSLEKQARRAQEYERIKADLRILLRDWYGYHWRLTQQELSHAKEVVSVQETRLERARSRQAEIDEQITTGREGILAIRSRLNIWHTESSRLHLLLERTSRELAILEERGRAFTNQSQNIQTELARLEEEISADQARVEGARKEKERQAAEVEEARRQLDTAQKVLQTRQDERAVAEKALRQVRQKLVALETQQVKQKAHWDELQQRHESQRRSLETAQKNYQAGQPVISAAQAQLDSAKVARDTAETRKNQARQDLAGFRQRLTDLEQDRRSRQEHTNHLESERARLKVQIEAIEAAEKSFSGMAEGARVLLKAARDGRIRGGMAPLGSQLDVPAELEVAISAALGEYFDLVVLDQNGRLEDTLAYLEGNSQGRAALLPAEWLSTPSLITLPHDPACIGVAAGLVRGPEPLHSAIDFILGRVLVVQDRSAAIRLRKQIPPEARIVTLAGEVFHASGPVIAGKEGKKPQVSRPRQKREFIEALSSLDKDLQMAGDEQKKINDLISQLNEDSRAGEKRARTSDEQFDQAVSTFQQATLAVDQTRRQNEWYLSQTSTLEGQLKKTQEEIARASQELSTLDHDIRGLRDQVREGINALNRLPIDELNLQVSHWNTQLAVANRSAREAANRLEESIQGASRSQKRKQGLETRLAELATGQAQVDEDRATHLASEKTLSEQNDRLQSQIRPVEVELEQAEKVYASLQEDSLASQQALTVAERYASQAQLELTRKREALDSLRRRIEDDFGLVALEFSADLPGQDPLPLEGMVEQLPTLSEIPGNLEEQIARQRAQLRRMGAINPEALAEYQEVNDRYHFMTTQIADLRKADADLRQVISELDELMKREFRKTFDAVAGEFRQMFTRLFAGGSARLVLIDADNPDETGIEIEARLPGRREQGLSLLSGGERSLTAVALVFSLLRVSPTPFCVMDEVDAMLDEANVGRFRDMLQELSQSTQFIVITHNRNTVQAADVIYGVTMGRDSASQVISLKLEDVGEEMTR